MAAGFFQLGLQEFEHAGRQLALAGLHEARVEHDHAQAFCARARPEWAARLRRALLERVAVARGPSGAAVAALRGTRLRRTPDCLHRSLRGRWARPPCRPRASRRRRGWPARRSRLSSSLPGHREQRAARQVRPSSRPAPCRRRRPDARFLRVCAIARRSHTSGPIPVSARRRAGRGAGRAAADRDRREARRRGARGGPFGRCARPCSGSGRCPPCRAAPCGCRRSRRPPSPGTARIDQHGVDRVGDLRRVPEAIVARRFARFVQFVLLVAPAGGRLAKDAADRASWAADRGSPGSAAHPGGGVDSSSAENVGGSALVPIARSAPPSRNSVRAPGARPPG